MSEGRRVNITTISSAGSFSVPNAPVAASSTRFDSDLFAEPSHDTTATSSNKERQTIRLSLELSPTDKVTYPEVNYARLMRLEEKKRKKLRQKINGTAASSTSMPFEENDDDVARIAAELEKKYGCAYGRSRGRSKRDDHCDIGMGYDESDSFIDNTDAYDENIPEEVETVEGGFYINCGALEFKQLNTEAVKLKTDEIIKMPNKSRKRILSISSSSDDSSSSENDDDHTLTNDKIEQNDSESSSGCTSKSKTVKTKRLKKDKKDGASDKKSIQQNGKKKEKINSPAITVSTSNSPKPNVLQDEAASDGSDKDPRQKTVKTTTIKDMLKAKRDSYLKMQVDGGVGAAKSANGEVRGSKSSDEDESSDSSDDDDDDEDDSKSETASNQSLPDKPKYEGKSDATSNATESNEKYRTTETKLPELEVEVATNIQSFKELVKSKNIIGKRFQFDDELTEIFLRIDETLLCIEKSQRSMVFAHLEYHLVLPKYSLLRKAKQLRVKMEKMKTQRALAKLRKAVIEAMPAVINSYEIEVQKYTESQAANPAGVNTLKMPKKRFPWNNHFRNLLYDAYQSCWISYPVLRGRKETLKDFITLYLKEKVVEVWPNGWMRLEELQKEIEKRKQANKKSKENKSENTNPASTSNTQAFNNQISAPTVSAVPTTTTLNSFGSKFEEFAGSRSSCNSDNDSVASSNASNRSNIKRKSKTDGINENKVKITKNNMKAISSNGSRPCIVEEPTYTNTIITTNNTTLSSIRNDLNTVPNSDCQTYSVIEATGTTVLNPTILSSPSQNNSTHSNLVTTATATTTAVKPTTAHVIDLDQYSSASDILEKSKQLQASVNIIPSSSSSSPSPSLTTTGDPKYSISKLERTSSSDSDGVEIVGVFEVNQHSAALPKVRAKKSQQLQQNSLTKSTALYNNNNNNNNNKKLATRIPNAFDMAMSALKDMERSQQHAKPKNATVNVKEPPLQ